MMNRSVVGGPMSQQPGALENVKYLTTRYNLLWDGFISLPKSDFLIYIFIFTFNGK